jgi:hypothetical protein
MQQETTRNKNAQLFCIHVIASVLYGYAVFPPAIDQYFKDIEDKVQSWSALFELMASNLPCRLDG